MGHLRERTDSNRAADQPCSSDASAAASTEVESHCGTVLAGRSQLGLKLVY